MPAGSSYAKLLTGHSDRVPEVVLFRSACLHELGWATSQKMCVCGESRLLFLPPPLLAPDIHPVWFGGYSRYWNHNCGANLERVIHNCHLDELARLLEPLCLSGQRGTIGDETLHSKVCVSFTVSHIQSSAKRLSVNLKQCLEELWILKPMVLLILPQRCLRFFWGFSKTDTCISLNCFRQMFLLQLPVVHFLCLAQLQYVAR